MVNVGERCYYRLVDTPPNELEFRILGPVEVRAGGEVLQLGGPKQRALLALLLIDAGRAVSTDRLVDALWGERPPRTAQTSLQNFVSQLRKLLGTDVLVTKPPGYLLRVEPGRLDAGRARALAEFGFEAFAQPEIARLEELRLSVLEDRLDADLEAGRHAELVGELEALVEEDALPERF